MSRVYTISKEIDYSQRLDDLQSLFESHPLERVAPVYTNDVCVNDSKAETGIFRAHKAAWNACANQSEDRCIVLERDWSIGDQPTEVVADELKKIKPSADLYMIGHCFNDACLHAYILSKDLASQIKDTDECSAGKPVDLWLTSKLRSEGRDIQMHPKENMTGHFGEGLIQQDRMKFKGFHNQDNSTNTEY